MKLMKGIFLLILTLFLVSPGFAQNVGDQAPDFSYKNTSGMDVKLSDYSGKVVFLFLLGSNCGNCKEVGNKTEKLINQAYSVHEDFQAIGLDLWDGNISAVNAFIQFTGITYPVLINAGNMSTDYSSSYDRGIVVDRDGIIRYKGSKIVLNDFDNIVAAIDAQFSATAVGDIAEPIGYSLGQAYPNPSSDNTNISFSIAEAGHVKLSLYNSLGQLTEVILNSALQAGSHEYAVSTADLSDGMYYYKIHAGSYSATHKLLVRN